LVFSTNGQQRAIINATGDVVLNNTSLRVNGFGGISVDGVIYFGSSDSYIYRNNSQYNFVNNANTIFNAVLDSGGTILTSSNFSGYSASEFPSGTKMPFAQASAPTGWTQDTSEDANNRMLRVVNAAGGGTGGTHSPILNNVVPAHTHSFTTGTISANHVHYDSGHNHQSTTGGNFSHRVGVTGGPNDAWFADFAGSTDTGWGYASIGGVSSNHTHSGSTDNGSSQTNWTPKYIDMIICTKN
jgi:hypothetical protein